MMLPLCASNERFVLSLQRGYYFTSLNASCCTDYWLYFATSVDVSNIRIATP